MSELHRKRQGLSVSSLIDLPAEAISSSLAVSSVFAGISTALISSVPNSSPWAPLSSKSKSKSPPLHNRATFVKIDFLSSSSSDLLPIDLVSEL